MSDYRSPFPARGRPRTRSSSRRFLPPRPQLQSLSAPTSSNSMTHPHISPTVENRPQYLHYPPPQPHYRPPHTGYITPYASQPMVTTPTYAYSVHSPIDMQTTMGLPMYMHSQQQDSSSSNLPSPHPTPLPQHGHVSPPPPVTSAPPHFHNTPGYHSMSYSSQGPTHFGYPSTQSYPNPGYQPAYLPPSFHPPYQTDQDGQWWYSGQYDSPQYLHQQPYHMTYQPRQQQLSAEYYQRQQLQSGSSDAQVRSPQVSQPQTRFTPTRPESEPTAPTPPSPQSSPKKSDSPGKSPPPLSGGREAVRQPYHPNPPPQRSEWVMWAGNVPSDATNEELWRFFNKTPDSSDGATGETSGVSSIFLIARSNCAFVNFDTEAHLGVAITRFNGQKIRPDDPKCPNLVCRVRKKTDDLRAGVGGQRGVGLHLKWIQERKQKGKLSAKSPVDDVARGASSLSLTSDEEGSAVGEGNRSFEQSSGSGSFASTTSSVLAQHFPKRYFILKSLTQYDLDLSVEKGVWATQRHNEVILDQAFRTSNEVYLIFGVNKSGEFYGYARMAGPILQSDTKVAWASRTNSPTLARGERTDWTPSASSSDPPSSRIILPLAEHRFANSSPSPFYNPGSTHSHNPLNQPQPPGRGCVPLTSNDQGRAVGPDELHIPGTANDEDGLSTPNRETVSAPAELHQLHRKITIGTPEAKLSSGNHKPRGQVSKRTQSTPISKLAPAFQQTLSAQRAISEMRQKESREFHLDRTAPIRALRHPPASASTGAGGQAGNTMGTIEEQRGQSGTPVSMLDDTKRNTPPVVDGTDESEHIPSPGQEGSAVEKRTEEPQSWGEPFRLEWIKTERLPFYRTRHLRNPWNHDREIKVSRDGTELEPTVGQALLEEWDRVIEVHPTEKTSQQPGQGGTSGGSRQQGKGKGGAIGSQRGKR